MTSQKSREEQIREALQEYKRKYRPIYISFLIKEEFFDIINLEEKSISDELTDEEWVHFKAGLIDCLRNLDFQEFIAKYFKNAAQFDFKDFYSDYYCRLVWNFKCGTSGSSLFDRAGAAMICDVQECWIIVIFSAESIQWNTYEKESSGLEKLINQLLQS